MRRLLSRWTFRLGCRVESWGLWLQGLFPSPPGPRLAGLRIPPPVPGRGISAWLPKDAAELLAVDEYPEGFIATYRSRDKGRS